jgi:S-adenosylmethionine:tRNA ribosyltransferase-isomerase
VSTAPATRFELPAELSATQPPEARGIARDGVRLLVADPERVEHVRFRELARYLRAGDLLVVNVSATLPAAVDGVRAGRAARDARAARDVVVHFSTALEDGTWVVELRRSPSADGPVLDGALGERIRLPGEGGLTLVAPYPAGIVRARRGQRLWRAAVDLPDGVPPFLARRGRPIRYGYVTGQWPLSSYQTVFATEPGSAEMPSAGRPFTAALVARLVADGVVLAPVVLHTGVSSPEAWEAPLPERFRVPAPTVEQVRLAHRLGHRVIAVGTTVARALESALRPDGRLEAATAWTDLVLGPERPARVIDGILTGLHAPDASHLLLLEAVVGPDVVRRAYDAALRQRYLWHEFGDACLLLAQPSHGQRDQHW